MDILAVWKKNPVFSQSFWHSLLDTGILQSTKRHPQPRQHLLLLLLLLLLTCVPVHDAVPLLLLSSPPVRRRRHRANGVVGPGRRGAGGRLPLAVQSLWKSQKVSGGVLRAVPEEVACESIARQVRSVVAEIDVKKGFTVRLWCIMYRKQEQTLFKDLRHWQDIEIEKIRKDQKSSK